uniref:transmembrane protein 154 n=1 Tax=Odobenus rosmarus divergens TaxID=9708 RepID=UPI00063CEEA1|nr:PREDICTED: transmembrane protein 154 [Odobenus rosmarus divergens]
MPGRRADRKAPRAALAFALVITLLPTSQARGTIGQYKSPVCKKDSQKVKNAAFPDFSEETEQSAEMPLEEENRDEDFYIQTVFVAVTTGAFMANSSFGDIDEDENQLEFVLMVLIPLVLFALLFLSVIILVIRYKRKRTKQEPSSQGSQSALQTCELGSENIKVPIFEEDTPSVMEIEMEELDKWMNSMNRNADCECLPTLKEEKESNHNPRMEMTMFGVFLIRELFGQDARSVTGERIDDAAAWLWSIMTRERFDAGLLPSSELGNIRQGQTEGALEDKLVRRPKKADLLPPATQGQLGNEVFRAASGLVSLLAFQ